MGRASEVSSAENKDREIVYAGIAKLTGSAPDQVGRARAGQLLQRSGVWLQRESGEWYRK
ncbi:MAG: YdbL family protein [Bryobacterales bacterium]|nr:YdbL family protein [Bryobacterales bacterium]